MWRPRSALSHWSIAAPSSRTTPCLAGHIPTSAFESEVFPDALAPSSANPVPAFSENEISDTIGLSVPGAVTQRPCTEISRHGRGSATCGNELFPRPERDFDRRQGPAHQDRRGDHDTARCLVGNHEIGTDAQHPRLQHIAHYLRTRSEIGIHVG